MLKAIAISLCLALLGGCSYTKVAPIDPATGYFPSTKKATVVTSKAVDLDQRKSVVLTPNPDFTYQMIINLNYFDRVMNFKDLEQEIVRKNLTEQVPSLFDSLGVSNAAKKLGGFLWVRWQTRQDGARKYQQLVLVDAQTLEEYFVVETYLDYEWAGVNDQNNFYPMFNALIDYIKQNSKTYGK